MNRELALDSLPRISLEFAKIALLDNDRVADGNLFWKSQFVVSYDML
jgi:hypothetical protein